MEDASEKVSLCRHIFIAILLPRSPGYWDYRQALLNADHVLSIVPGASMYRGVSKNLVLCHSAAAATNTFLAL